MTSQSSKAIPFVAMTGVILIAVLRASGYDVPVIETITVLTAFGIAGVPKSLMEKALMLDKLHGKELMSLMQDAGLVVKKPEVT